ncbi:MAG TPA: LamG-like jellyroll fold domain-containing protein, partial [Pirellulaceae bacterium]|nr:LamG-like jellyroll fold domain-containing protein [Pirellulaceae bacterium]
MSEPISQSQAAERALFRRLVDDQLSPDEFAGLEQRLLADREFRLRCVRYMDLEASLYEALSVPLSLPEEGAKGRSRRGRRWKMAVVGTVLAAAAVVLIAVFVGRRTDRPGAEYLEAKLKGLEVAAIITHVEGLPADSAGRLKEGMRLKPGSLKIQQGQLQLEFLGGAKLLVAGPAELHILSPKSATLVSGRAATRVLQWGHGFVLNTPEAVMVDLGTEFAVGVDELQGSSVQVVDGEVEVSVLGEDGSTLTSERLEQDGALRIRKGATTLEPDKAPLPPLTIRDEPPRPLAVPESYVRTVLQAKPTLYWRFESLAGGVVPNEAGSLFAAELQMDASDPDAVRVGDGQLHLAQSAGPRFLATTEPIPKLNAKSYSVEMWVNPAMLHWATLMGIVPEADAKSLTHLNVIELAHQTPLVHEPGAFRFMHRHPPEGKGGVNIFTASGCTPGRWHHLVSVKTPNELRLYLNGQLTRRLDGTMGSDEAAYHVLLGELRATTPERQFVGSLD